jgi:uncharacterized protein DUF3592
VPSSTTSKPGCGWRTVFVAFGGFALLAGALFLFGAGTSWWQGYQVRNRWPAVNATVQHCEITKHRRRNSVQLVYFAECAITFNARGENVKGGVESLPAYYEHRPQWWASPGIDELRAWISAHPAGSVLSVHYNPDWPPQTEPVPTPAIFDRYSTAVTLRLAGIAAIVGLCLIGIAAGVPR